MKTLDLRHQKLTLPELLGLARSESLLIVDERGEQFVLELADAFEQEVAQLAQSEEFMAFLAERSREPATTSLDDVERRLSRATKDDRSFT